MGDRINDNRYVKNFTCWNQLLAMMFGQLSNPDIILICGGTNDSWANVPIGNYQYSNWKRADLYCFRPALATLLSDLRQRHPNVDIYFILNSELKEEINESVKKICKTYQVPVIALHGIDKKNGHPSIKGMRSSSLCFYAP